MNAVRMSLLSLPRRAVLTLRPGLSNIAHSSTSAPGPPMELSKLHYPPGSGSRKYRTEKQAGQMSVSQINHILKTNEYSYTVSRSGPSPYGVLSFHSNQLPANQPSEDRRSSATCLTGRSGMLFGVFDGHAGPACAQAVSERLFYYISVAMLPVRTLAEMEAAVEEERPVAPVLEWHKHPNDHSCRDAGQLSFTSLRTYWQERLDLGLEEAQDEEEEEERASSALINAFRRLDSDLSLEAQVDFSESSPRRLPLPGESLSLSSPLRVALSGCTACVAHVSDGFLNVANLGDSRAVLGVQEPDGRWSGSWTTTITDTTTTSLRWQTPLVPSRTLTLGSMQRLLVERRDRALSALEDQNAATHLLRHALGNDGYGGVEPRRLAKMLSLPKDLARMYRDDITITIIYLNDPDM